MNTQNKIAIKKNEAKNLIKFYHMRNEHIHYVNDDYE